MFDQLLFNDFMTYFSFFVIDSSIEFYFSKLRKIAVAEKFDIVIWPMYIWYHNSTRECIKNTIYLYYVFMSKYNYLDARGLWHMRGK